jgi:drug/metabolite transporter (DMT)-like permease
MRQPAWQVKGRSRGPQSHFMESMLLETENGKFILHISDVTISTLKALGILTAWYLSATIAAWHLSGVLHRTEFQSIEFSCFLMMIGSLITMFNLLLDPKFYRKGLKVLRNRSIHQASIWHYIGTLSMCMAQAAFSASLTQTVKSTEPVLALIFSWIMHGRRTDLRRFIGIVCISAGVAFCCIGDISLNSAGVLYALISACSFPLRNCA